MDGSLATPYTIMQSMTVLVVVLNNVFVPGMTINYPLPTSQAFYPGTIPGRGF